MIAVKENKQHIAVCIPTIHRTAEIKDFLANCVEYYIKAGCDIYYFDSNEDDKTEKLIKQYSHDDHVFYIRTAPNLELDAAVLIIFEYIKEREYNYIWLCTDSIQYSKEALNIILQHTSKNYDMISVDFSTNQNSYFEEVTDPLNYFSRTAYISTLFGAVLINSETMLKKADWNYYQAKFSDPKVKAFACIHFYYHRILQLSSFCGAILSLGKNRFMNSRLKKDSIYVRDSIYTWCGQWSSIINDLPSAYDPYKIRAIRQIGSSFFPDADQFLRMRLDDIYSLENYLQYEDKWEDITSVPKEELLEIALRPKADIERQFRYSLESGTQKLKRFCKNHSKVMILGAGSVGNAYGVYFNKCGIQFDAFCVLHRKDSLVELLDHPIYLLDDILENNNGVGFVLGMGRNDAKMALTVVKGIIPDEDIFFDPMFRRDLMFSLGYRRFFSW